MPERCSGVERALGGGLAHGLSAVGHPERAVQPVKRSVDCALGVAEVGGQVNDCDTASKLVDLRSSTTGTLVTTATPLCTSALSGVPVPPAMPEISGA